MLNLKFFVQRKVNKNKPACKRVDAGFDQYPAKNPFSVHWHQSQQTDNSKQGRK